MSTPATPTPEAPAAPAAAPSAPSAPAATLPAIDPQVIEAVRQEEKAKLFGHIADLEKKLDAEKQTAAQKADLEKKLAEAQAQLDAISKSKTSTGEIDVKSLLKEASEITRKENQARIDELQQRLDRQEANLKAERLAAFKQKLIAEANGKTIVGLISGSNEEELRASATHAREQYDEIVKEYQKPSGEVPPPSGSVPPPVNPRANTGGGAPAPVGPEAARGMSISDYGKNRGSVLADLKKQFG